MEIPTVFTIPPLANDSFSYIGPTGPGDSADLCKCNTVVYSLMSACDACQGANWFSYVRFPPVVPRLGVRCGLTKDISMMMCRWNTWSYNCTSVDPPQTFVFSVSTCALFRGLTDGSGFRIPFPMGRACQSGLSST